MRRFMLYFLYILILIFSFSCTEKEYIVISYETNGGLTLNPQYLYKDDRNHYIDLRPKKEGYKFIGWYTEPSFTQVSKVAYGHDFKEDTTLYAKWEIETYIISVQYFDLEKKYYAKYGEEFTFEKLIYKDYHFKYFYWSNNKLPDTIIVKCDMYINASFEELNFGDFR